VAIFFVLSGFLITTRLVDEKQRNGSISLIKFYLRRFFRLMPCAWFYLLFVFVITIANQHRDTTMRGILGSIFFVRNYIFRGETSHPLTTHFWSLSIEEQFYLIWPSVLVFANLKLARWMAVTGALAIALYRFIHWTNLENHIPLTTGTHVRADALLVGCAVALFLPNIKKYLRPWMSIPLLVGMILCGAKYHVLIPLHESLMIGLLLALTSQCNLGAIGHLLNWKPLAFIGTLSYSIYMWQELFVVLIRNSGPRLYPYWLLLVPVALGSYYLIEKPLIERGRKLTSSFKTDLAECPMSRF